MNRIRSDEVDFQTRQYLKQMVSKLSRERMVRELRLKQLHDQTLMGKVKNHRSNGYIAKCAHCGYQGKRSRGTPGCPTCDERIDRERTRNRDYKAALRNRNPVCQGIKAHGVPCRFRGKVQIDGLWYCHIHARGLENGSTKKVSGELDHTGGHV